MLGIGAFQQKYPCERVEHKIVKALVERDEKIFQSFLFLKINHIIREVGLAMLESVKLSSKLQLRIILRLQRMPSVHKRNQGEVNQGEGLSLWLKDLVTHSTFTAGPSKHLLKHRELLSEQERSDLLKKFVRYKKWDLATPLILEGVDIPVDERGYSLLHHVVELGSYLLVNHLLNQENLPDLYQKTKEGATFLDLAIRAGNPLVIDELVKEGVRNTNLECGKELWFVFAKYGCYEKLRGLLNFHSKIDVNSRTEKGKSALQWAMSKKHWCTARILLKKGASSQTKNGKWSPLHYAAYHGKVSLIRLIYSNDPEINFQISEVKSARTPLHLACQRGHLYAANFLLRRDADPACVDASGNTLFHVLAGIQKFDKNLCAALKKYIDPSKRNKEGKTALEIAFEAENSEFLRCFFWNFPELLEVLPEKNDDIKFLIHRNLCGDILSEINDDPFKFISQFYQDNDDRTDALLEVAFLLDDGELAYFVAIHTSELQYKSAINGIKKTYSAAQIDLLEEACLEVNPAHLTSLKQETLKEPEKKRDIKILKKIFLHINFKYEKKLGYIDTKSMQSEGIITVESLKKGIDDLVDRIKNRTPFLGTPPANDTEALEKFYQNLELVVKNILDKLLSKMKLNKDGFLDEKTAFSIVNLSLIGQNCGGRYIGGSLLLLDTLSDRTRETWKDYVDVFFHDLRRNIALGMTGTGSHNSHNFTQVLKMVGLKTGMLGAIAADYDDPYEPHLEQYEIEYDFFCKYRPSELIEKLHQALLGKKQLPASLFIDWIKKNIPKAWKEKETERIKNLINVLEKTKMSSHYIRKNLEKKHKIYLRKGLNWNAALKEDRQYSFLEKKVYNMISGELTRYSIRFYLLNSGFLKEIWVK